MVDVAKHAGVSLKTVSRVVNNEPVVGRDLVDRVMASISDSVARAPLRQGARTTVRRDDRAFG